ncbi:MAG TPA: amidase family protein, partial [Thermomicrobiales bacterium]|nr:amidase family protein [Thermomicrobiales bacterium]
MSSDELVYRTATDLARSIRQKELSAREVMQAHLAQIARVNPKVNAIVTRISDDEALALADAADEQLARGDEVGVLHGLPIAHKDLEDTAGMRTTYGSPIFADNVPKHDTLMISRLKAAGALTIGKTNVPEWGAGSQTFNPVFGPTLNPYDTTRTCGGSSGGAAVTLACGMAPIADGSDMGGSLRNPGNFNNVVGLRPSPGRVPVSGSSMPWIPLGVKGPMARTVADVALLLSTIAGYDRHVQLAIEESGDMFRQPLDRDFSGVRIAFSADLGGLPVDPRVRAVLEAGRPVFESLGCSVEEDAPDFSGADDAFRDLRAFSFSTQHVDLIARHREMYKDTVIWNVEEGLKLSGV